MEYVCLIVLLAAMLTGIAVMVRARGTCGEFDYLLVLGTKVNGQQPGNMLRDRIDAAACYLQANPRITCIVSGYKSGVGEISEAECMRRELIALDIESARIWPEPNASSTAENLEFTMRLIEKKTGEKPEKLGILSSEHHLLRAGLLAARQGIQCVLIPAKTARFGVFAVNFLREIPLIWYYSFFYRRKRI